MSHTNRERPWTLSKWHRTKQIMRNKGQSNDKTFLLTELVGTRKTFSIYKRKKVNIRCIQYSPIWFHIFTSFTSIILYSKPLAANGTDFYDMFANTRNWSVLWHFTFYFIAVSLVSLEQFIVECGHFRNYPC